MTEELQQLLDRIRTEGVEKAQAEAQALVEQARREAGEIVARAEAEAKAFRETAQRDADAYQRRAEQSIRQAARDVLIQVEQDLVKRFEGLLSREVGAAVADEASFRRWVSEAVAAYLKGGDKEVEVVVGGGAAAQAAGLLARLRQEAGTGQGITIASNPAFPAGFTLRLQGGRVAYSFTAEAITAALARLLRPQLAKLLAPAT
jgi:V/A-type H+-transporting ATPase subunit E